jgi:hypothetical protein
MPRVLRLLSRAVNGGQGPGEPGQEPGEPSASGEPRVRRAGLIGAGLAGIGFLVVLLNGRLSLLRSDIQGNFYDLQAHALLAGRWNVPLRTLGLEGFRIDGKNYMYFGPWPAFLRLPFAAVTHELDGRLSQLSMLLAFGIAMWFTVRLVVRIRGLVRPEAPVTRPECWAVGVFVLASGLAVPLFLATRLIVFHEAELWGIALALAAFDFVLVFTTRPRAWTLALAAGCATAALLSRPTLGAGPVVALGLLAMASVSERTRGWLGFRAGSARLAGGLVLAAVIPVGLYAAVNFAKFQTPFGLPFDRQFVTFVSPEHRAVLAANGGSLFGLQFLPTNLLQYFRPDGIDLSRLVPWVRFPAVTTVIGDVRYDRITPTTSVVAAMPLLAVLSVVGLVAMLSPRRARETRVAALRAPVIGAAVATGPVLIFGFMAQRYLGDFVPLLVVLGAIGFHVSLAWCTRLEIRARAVTWAALAVVSFVAIWFGIGLAVIYQRVASSDEAELRDFVRTQLAVQRRFPGGAPELTHVARLPGDMPLGTVAVVGNCDGVFVSSGNAWRALERSPATGGYRLRVTFPTAPGTTSVAPLLRAGSSHAPMMFFVESKPNGRQVIGYSSPDGRTYRSKPLTLAAGPHTIDLVLDPQTQEVVASVDGAAVLRAVTIPAVRTIVAPIGAVTIGDGGGRAPAPGRFPGAIKTLPPIRTLCHDLER